MAFPIASAPSIATSDILRERPLECRLDARRGRERLTVEIVDHLCVDVCIRLRNTLRRGLSWVPTIRLR